MEEKPFIQLNIKLLFAYLLVMIASLFPLVGTFMWFDATAFNSVGRWFFMWLLMIDASCLLIAQALLISFKKSGHQHVFNVTHANYLCYILSKSVSLYILGLLVVFVALGYTKERHSLMSSASVILFFIWGVWVFLQAHMKGLEKFVMRKLPAPLFIGFSNEGDIK